MSRVVHNPVVFEVLENGTLYEHYVIEARIRTQTEWRCPSCKVSWTKRGSHLGTYHTCARCKAGFWLRAAT